MKLTFVTKKHKKIPFATTKWVLATEKNSLLKPTKTTVLFSNSIYHIHIVAFFVPERNLAHPLPKPSTPSSSSPILITTLHLRCRRHFTLDASDTSAHDRDASDTGNASACFWSRRFRRQQPFSSRSWRFRHRRRFCSDRWRFSSNHDASVSIAMLQLSIPGDASSFTTSGDALVRDASRCFFFLSFWVNFFVNFRF